MSEIFDREALLERVEGDEAFLDELLATFFEYTPGQIREMREALAEGDARRLHEQAHSLKGAAASISALALTEAAQLMESAGKARAVERCGPLLAAVEHEFTRLQETLPTHARA